MSSCPSLYNILVTGSIRCSDTVQQGEAFAFLHVTASERRQLAIIAFSRPHGGGHGFVKGEWRGRATAIGTH